ncbi:thioredoxin family protein [Galbibacter orientalis]|uniref:Thioredoxin n=1 Tax=Galbibacter orientalis DSM 19592 TaxID=926559 RepID=I3CAM7_9FLAO|nr:thioredoxin family protein [Galbibacter orientalis]EIJ40670.1 Thioredoxin [Galbibacter orientalis DSM 19592]
MYQKLLILIIFFSSTCLGFSQEKSTDELTELVEWVYNVDEGIKLGEKADKDVIIYFGMKKCVPCRFIKKYAFVTEEFKEYSKKFVMVKIYDDLDKENTENQEYVKKYREIYGIESVPTMVLLKRNGEQDSFFTYVRKPDDLINQIEEYYN